jgi:hypothetical protein
MSLMKLDTTIKINPKYFHISMYFQQKKKKHKSILIILTVMFLKCLNIFVEALAQSLSVFVVFNFIYTG